MDNNIIVERHETAVLMNYRLMPVVAIDLDNKDTDGELIGSSEVRVKYRRRDCEKFATGTLIINISEGKRVYRVYSWGTMLTSDFTFEDRMELIAKTQAPEIEAGELVAVAEYSRSLRTAYTRIMRVGKNVDPHCMEVVRLEEIDDIDFEEVKRRIYKYLQ